MKPKIKSPILLQNRITKEQWLCDDLYLTKDIDGQQFLEVYKQGTGRKLLVKRDVLEKIKR